MKTKAKQTFIVARNTRYLAALRAVRWSARKSDARIFRESEIVRAENFVAEHGGRVFPVGA